MSGKTLRVSAAVVAVAFIALLIVVRALAGPRDWVVRLQPLPDTRSDTLIVILHGFAGRASLDELSAVTAETFPGAHILRPDYDANFLRRPAPARRASRWDARHVRKSVTARPLVPRLQFGTCRSWRSSSRFRFSGAR